MKWVRRNHQYKQLRLEIFVRDGGKCRRCSSSKNLQLHHIDGNPHNDEKTNLETLCDKCHLKHEKKKWWEKNTTKKKKVSRQRNSFLLFTPSGFQGK